MFKYFLYILGRVLTKVLPVSFSYRIAVFIADCQHMFSSKDRKAVENNLKIIVGQDAKAKEIAPEVFRNFGKYLVDFFLAKERLRKEYIDKHVQINNMDVLKQIQGYGKGGIILTAHIGNWEYGGAIISSFGFPLTAIALQHKEKQVNSFFNRQREISGMRVVPTTMAVRKCIEALRKNEFIALLADRDFGSSGEVLDFLGKKALIPKGAATFSMKTGAPIIPVFFLRQGKGYSLNFMKPIYPESGLNDKVQERKEMFSIMKKCTSVIEKQIKENPGQWLMFREFWLK